MVPATRIFDTKHNIIEIVWTQNAQPDDIDKITNEIKEFTKSMNGKFDVIVDFRNVKAFPPESQAKLVEHQKSLLEFGMHRAAVIVSGVVAKLQLNRSAKQSEHNTESHFNSYEEALEFLRGTN